MLITRDRQESRNIYERITERASDCSISKHRAYAELLDELFTKWAWPGGYTIIFLENNGDSSVLCADCARKSWRQGNDIYCDTYDDGPTEYCADCNCEIESSYGDPDNPDN